MGFSLHKGIRSVVKRLEFIAGRILHIILRGHWCDIVLNAHAPNENKNADTKESFYEELVCI
jgi:hypothetical protein